MPPDTVKVDRATRWGNPFRIGEHGDAAQCVAMFGRWLETGSPQRDDLESARARILRGIPELRGKHLACWCRPGTPCHADVLLGLANRATED
jgi:hypothetical protein